MGTGTANIRQLSPLVRIVNETVEGVEGAYVYKRVGQAGYCQVGSVEAILDNPDDYLPGGIFEPALTAREISLVRGAAMMAGGGTHTVVPPATVAAAAATGHALDHLDGLTRALTAFASFGDLLNAPGNYRPSLWPDSAAHVALAGAYDFAQERRGDSRRAYRG